MSRNAELFCCANHSVHRCDGQNQMGAKQTAATGKSGSSAGLAVFTVAERPGAVGGNAQLVAT
jgi:hypothetical protein